MSADRGRLDLPTVAPHSSVTVALPCVVPRGPGEVHLIVRWRTLDDKWYAPASHLVAWDQVAWRSPRTRTTKRSEQLDPVWTVPALNLFRAPTDNDGFKLMPVPGARRRGGGPAWWRWSEAGLDKLPADEFVDHLHSVAGDGTTHRHVVDLPEQLADLARVGVTFIVPGRFSHLRWFGRGPHENYPDRNRSAMVAIWDGVPDQSPYLVPQEFGLRTDCRWFELIDDDAAEVVRIDAVNPGTLHVSATHSTPLDLLAASTATELRPRDEIVVCVDVAHRGLGTASCGPDVLDRYRLQAGRYDFSYQLRRVLVH